MAIGIQRGRHGLMAQQLLDDLGVDAGLQQDGRRRVAQVMNPDLLPTPVAGTPSANKSPPGKEARAARRTPCCRCAGGPACLNYPNAGEFRMALEQRLLNRSRENGTSLARLKKAVVFDRLLARLFVAAPDRWVLKGALALDYCLGRERGRPRMLSPSTFAFRPANPSPRLIGYDQPRMGRPPPAGEENTPLPA
jgi:hypothetical protein